MKRRAPLTVVVFAGLPGTGKSTLARRLARELDAPLFDKDALREAFFGPDHVRHSTEQDDFVMQMIYRAVDHTASTRLAGFALVDGRTFTRRGQTEELEKLARKPALELRLIECVCQSDAARQRLARDVVDGAHPARNRTPRLFDELAADAVELQLERLVLDSTRSDPETLAQRALTYVLEGRHGS